MRRMERTNDPHRLAQHLSDAFRELAHTADQLPQHDGDWPQLRKRLAALKHQAGNMSQIVDLATGCLDDAIRHGEPPEWEVAVVETSQQETAMEES